MASLEEGAERRKRQCVAKRQSKVFLKRNPNLFLAAIIDGKLADTVMRGFDGRQVYVYHLAVADVNKR